MVSWVFFTKAFGIFCQNMGIKYFVYKKPDSPEFPNARMYMINSEEEWKIYEIPKHQRLDLRNTGT